MKYDIFVIVKIQNDKTIVEKLDNLCSNLNMTRKIIFSDPNTFDINYQFNNKLSSDELEQIFNNFCLSVKKEIDDSFISAILMSGDGTWGGTAISVDWIPTFVNT